MGDVTQDDHFGRFSLGHLATLTAQFDLSSEQLLGYYIELSNKEITVTSGTVRRITRINQSALDWTQLSKYHRDGRATAVSVGNPNSISLRIEMWLMSNTRFAAGAAGISFVE